MGALRPTRPPRQRVLRRAPPRALPLCGLALLTLVATAGCTAISDQLAGDGGVADDHGSASAATSGTSGTGAGSARDISTVAWSVDQRTVSVVVRNDSRRVLRRADAVVRAVDAEGITLASSATMPHHDVCCTATHVPPGGDYGFYLDVGDRGDQVTGVEIDYADLVWSATDPGPAITATSSGLETDETGAVAVVELSAAAVAPVVTVQARLDDAQGRLLAVVSGRWTCLQPGEQREARLQLFHPVPAGAVVSTVAAYAVDDPDPPAC